MDFRRFGSYPTVHELKQHIGRPKAALKQVDFAFLQEKHNSIRFAMVTNSLAAGVLLTRIIVPDSEALEFAIHDSVVVVADGEVDKVVSPVVGGGPVSEAVVLGPVAIVLFDSVFVDVGETVGVETEGDVVEAVAFLVVAVGAVGREIAAPVALVVGAAFAGGVGVVAFVVSGAAAIAVARVVEAKEHVAFLVAAVVGAVADSVVVVVVAAVAGGLFVDAFVASGANAIAAARVVGAKEYVAFLVVGAIAH